MSGLILISISLEKLRTEGDGSNGMSLGSGSATGFDIGFQGVLNKKYFVAYYLQNIISYSEGSNLGQNLPETISIGISYLPYKDLTTSLDINRYLEIKIQKLDSVLNGQWNH